MLRTTPDAANDVDKNGKWLSLLIEAILDNRNNGPKRLVAYFRVTQHVNDTLQKR